MPRKTLLISALAVPLLVLACNRAEQSPAAAAPAQEKQAQAPDSPDKILQDAPPAAGLPAPADAPALPAPDAQRPSSSPPAAMPPENR